MLHAIDLNDHSAYDVLLDCCVECLGVRVEDIRHLSVLNRNNNNNNSSSNNNNNGVGSGNAVRVLIDSTSSMQILSDMSIVSVSCYADDTII
jgi:hypothetical protein